MSSPNVELLKAVFGLAYADGELAEDESRLIEFLIDSAGLSAEEEALVRAQKDADVDLKNLAAAATEPAHRAKAYEMLALVANMDGAKSAAESDMLKEAKLLLAVEDDAAEAAERKAGQIYGRFVDRQSGDDDNDEDAGA